MINMAIPIFLGLIIMRRIRRAHLKYGYLRSVRSAEQPCGQSKRDINHAENRSVGKGRATKNLRAFGRAARTKNLGDFRTSSFSEGV